MAAPSSSFDTHQPVRSVSLPSRIHPPSVKLNAALNRLSSWQTSSSSGSITIPFGAETLQIGLINLSELYNCVHELLQSALTRRSLLQHESGKLVEDALDVSVTLLDTCDTTRNILISMKEHLQNLQSALRRKGTSDSSVEGYINAYFNLRKNAKKDISKCIGGLKKMEMKADSFQVLMNADYDLLRVVNVIREAITITISIFRCVLLFLSKPPSKTKNGGVLFSKLIPFVSEKEQKLMNEVYSLELLLCSYMDRRSRTSSSCNSRIEVQMVQKTLENLDDRFGLLEAGLHSMFKCLVRNRVAFLNIISSSH